MKVGIFLGTQHPAKQDIAQAFNDHVEQAQTMESLGFDSLWLAQHYFSAPDQFLQPTPMLGRLAAETGNMQLGTNILLLPLLNPADVAEQYATLDVICGGRLILGVGLGYRDIEFDTFKSDKSTRVSRFEESIEILKRLWTEGAVTHHGKHFDLEGVEVLPKPLQRPRPEIWIGATADKAVERAARVGDAWIGTNMATLTTLVRQTKLYDEARAAAGLEAPEHRVRTAEICVAPTTKEAWEIAEPYIGHKYAAYFGWGQSAILPDAPEDLSSFESIARDRFIIGSPEDVLERCIEAQAQLGTTHMILRFNFPGMPQELVLQSVRLFGEQVLPKLRAL